MELLVDPQIWMGLFTLIVLETVLDIDDLVFIAILTDKLPPEQHNKARLTGLSLALITRLGLLSVILWMVTLIKPPSTVMNYTLLGRDLTILLGGIFLLFKVTAKLHGRLKNREHDTGQTEGYANFWIVVTQIVILDTVFLLGAVVTATDMINYLPMMMAAVVIAMAVMLLASKPLARFVNQHPTVVVLRPSFLLMIGLSLVTEGFGFHIPKGYLYTATGLSIIIELLNQITHRDFTRHQSTPPLRVRTADVILRLVDGKRQASVQTESNNPAPALVPEGTLAKEERHVINGVLSLTLRSSRGIVMSRGGINWVNVDPGVAETHEQLLSSSRSPSPMYHGEPGEIIGIVRARELLAALEDGVDVAVITSVSSAIVVPETPDPISPLSVLRHVHGNFVIVTNELGVVQGLTTPLDVLETIAGEFPDANETPETIANVDGWLVKGGTDLHALQQVLDVDTLVDEDKDIAMMVGPVIATNGHIPHVDDVIEVAPLNITIVKVNDYRVGLVCIVKEQPARDEDE